MMIRKHISKTLVALAAVCCAMVAFSGVAEADIILNGVTESDPLTSSGVKTINGVNTVDGGSLWTHNNDLLKIGNRTTGSLTVSGAGVLNITPATVGDTFAFQVGNQGGGIAQALVTGPGSKVTTLTPIQVGRNSLGSTLTIEDGGLVVGQDVVLGRSSGSGFLRMGLGGVLAIEGAGKTLLSQMHTVQGGGEMQYNPLGDGTTWVNITGATGGGVDYTLADGTGDLAGYTVLTMAALPEPSDLAFTWIHLDPVSDRLALQWASRDEVLYDLLYSNDPAATFDPSAWSILTNGVSGTESSTEIFLPDFQGQSWSMVAPWWVFRLREQ
jgi:T5SS/PEP-CTERM-associated repeat protein